jgi:hypothetical protein
LLITFICKEWRGTASAPELDATARAVERDFHAGGLPPERRTKCDGLEQQPQTLRGWMLSAMLECAT